MYLHSIVRRCVIWSISSLGFVCVFSGLRSLSLARLHFAIYLYAMFILNAQTQWQIDRKGMRVYAFSLSFVPPSYLMLPHSFTLLFREWFGLSLIQNSFFVSIIIRMNKCHCVCQVKRFQNRANSITHTHTYFRCVLWTSKLSHKHPTHTNAMTNYSDNSSWAKKIIIKD